MESTKTSHCNILPSLKKQVNQNHQFYKPRLSVSTTARFRCVATPKGTTYNKSTWTSLQQTRILFAHEVFNFSFRFGAGMI